MARGGTAVASPGGRRVTRPPLIDALNAGSRVTLISASAGSGKTSLLRSWLHDADRRAARAMVTVRRNETQPERFWLSVIAALRETRAGNRLVGALAPAPDLVADAIVERLLDDLSTLDEPLWLILDDLHELSSEAALAQVKLLVAEAPEAMRFVFATRRDLRLGLHRLRLEGELTELRSADLRFTAPEARELLRGSGVELSESSLEQLLARTEGWAAGLRLAALSLAGHPDPQSFTAEFSGSDRTVADYLLAEVLEHQAEDVRRLLLRTSILEQVTGPLADRLTGTSSGARILDELERGGAFVFAVDAQRTTFRYHRLFADLLELELRRTAPDELSGLHTAAAEWFAEQGMTVEAVRHAQAGQRWDLAGRLLFEGWASLYLDGRRADGRELLAAFPPRMLSANAELLAVAVADQLANGSLDEAGRLLAIAARELPSVPEERRRPVEATLATLRMSHARQRNDADGVAVEAARLFDGPEALDAELDDHVRGLALVTIGISETLAGDPASGEGHLGRALDIARRLQRPYLELGTLTFLALACGARSPQLAEQYSREAIAIVDANGWQEEPVAAMGYVTLGVDRLWRARLGEAERWLELAQRAIGRETEPVTGFTLESAVGRLALLRGDPGSALRAFGQALRFGERLLSPHSLAPGTIAHMLVARLRAGAIQDAVDELAAMDDSVRARPELKVASAALALALDGPEAAIDVFGPGGARELGATHRWQTQALLIEAAAHGALGDAGASTRALESALDLAEPDGLLLPFLLFGDRELLERHRRSRTTHAALLADALTLLSGRDLDPLAADVEPLSEPLSESELRVLRYLPTNLRVPEIASELFVSPNTARTHIRRIYLKLGVHDRGEAVARGRDLGLLGPGAHLR